MGEITPFTSTMASRISRSGVRYLPSLSTTLPLSQPKKNTSAKKMIIVNHEGALGKMAMTPIS